MRLTACKIIVRFLPGAAGNRSLPNPDIWLVEANGELAISTIIPIN